MESFKVAFFFFYTTDTSFNESSTLKKFFGCLGLRCGADLHCIMWDMCCHTWALQVGPLIVARMLSCLRAYGILVPDKGLVPRPLHCKEDSLPLDYQGSPQSHSFISFFNSPFQPVMLSWFVCYPLFISYLFMYIFIYT